MIDANERNYGGAGAFRDLLGMLSQHLPETGPITAFLDAAYDTADHQIAAIADLRTALETGQEALTASWGADWYARVTEMVAVERASIDIRDLRPNNDDDAARAREDVIKKLADARIGETPRTVVNIGGTHAQKARLKGTSTEWLGEYLVDRSAAVSGTVVVVVVSAARTELEPGAGGAPFDVLTTSPPHELFRVLAETFPSQTVFLPLDDQRWADQTVAVNFEEKTYVATLKTHYDAVLQYGLAHRMPAD